MIRRTRTRRGATLVELLVAAAMSIMIMWLLTWCYQQGLASFSNSKSAADLMDQERMVTTVLTRDLLADHFLTDDGKPNGGRQVRDHYLYDPAYNPSKNNGFFYAYSNGVGLESPGAIDSDGFQSTISTDHILQFTSILPGGPSELLFNADVPFGGNRTVSGRAAEISYFLVPAGRTLGNTPLHNLIRRQRVCALTTDDRPAYNQLLTAPPAATYADASEVMAVSNTPFQISTLNELATDPNNRRLNPNPSNGNRQILITGNRYGEDILMSNVVSFEVKFTGVGTGWPRATSPDYPYDTLPGTGVYDTNSTSFSGVPSQKVRITGAMIRLRVHDPKSRTTRQTTVIVNL